MIDTIRLANRLVESGMARSKADALAAALSEVMSEAFATAAPISLADVKAMTMQLIAVWAALMVPMWIVLLVVLIAV